MSATFAEARPFQLGWLEWLQRELAPSHERKIRTAILVGGVVLCVIISMTLQVPEVATSAYMILFISKENKVVTTMVGVVGLISLTIGIVVSLLLFKFTYGHPEQRIPAMAIALFLGMYLSRVLTMGSIAFLLGFVIAATQSIGEMLPSPELVVRASLWLWVALVYSVILTVVLQQIFLPEPTGPPPPKPKGLFVPDAFTNPAHVRFGLKATLAAMFCYIFYSAVDWFGIHTAFITCVFIALESTGATLRKGALRAVGCTIGGLLALLSIVFLIPHMETIASLVILVACVTAIAAWVATGTERIAYAGLQIAFAFFYALFQGFENYAPATDLDNVRNRVVGILLGLFVTAVVFQYIWLERAIDRLRDALRQVFRQLSQLLALPDRGTPTLLDQISTTLAQARRQAELASFEYEASPTADQVSKTRMEKILAHAEEIFASAKSLMSDADRNGPAERQKQNRTALLSQIATETQHL
jgi:uncharacterized membrane protein YccC